MKGIIMIFIILSSNIFSQNKTIDSLKIELSKSNLDSVRVIYLLCIAKEYQYINPLLSIQYAEQAKTLSEKTNYLRGIASSCGWLGYLYQSYDDIPKSLSYNLKSLEVNKKMGAKKEISTCLNNIAGIYHTFGEIQKSLEYYQSSLKIREEIGNKIGIATTLNNIGNIYDHQGNFAQALEYYTKSLKINQENDYQIGIAAGLNNIGSIYQTQSDYNKAIDFYNQSLKILEKSEFKKGLATTVNNIGVIYEYLAEYSKASTYYFKSLKVREQIGDKNGSANALCSIGSLYYKRLNDFPNALEYLNKALKIQSENGDKKGMASSLHRIGSAYLKNGDFKSGKENGLLSLKIINELGFSSQINETLRLLFWIYSSQSSIDSASYYLSFLSSINNKSLMQNYSTLSEKEKEFYFSTLEKDYMLYYEFTSVNSKKINNLTDTSFNISLTNKGLTLKSSTSMRNVILSSNDTTLIKNYNEWRETKRKISKLYEKGKDTKELENKANELEKELVKKSNAFADFDKIKSLDWKQVQKSLKKGEAAIEFVHFKSEIDTTNPTKYAALIVKPESLHPEMITLFNEKDLIKILGSKTETGTDYINSIYGKRNKSNSQLYDLIWKPMEKSLKGVKTIYYSPSGLLHKISFAALSKGKDVYLCDNHRLELQGSTGKLAMPEKFEFNAESTVGIFGDINYDTPETLKDTTALLSWPYLEGTKTESEKVAAILKTNNYKYDYVAGKNATESEFKTKAPQNNIVHIATHGFFFPEPDAYTYAEKQDSTNKETQMYRSGERAVGVYNFIINKNPLMRSGLVFAGANEVWSRKEYVDKEDGVLTAQEVATLDLRKTNLVVLSACETGLGDVKGTEGVYGLQRSLKMAGVKFIIMSLWQVPDAETVEFMEKFYTKLTKTKDIKTSFYETRNEMRKKYDPFYWAAFVLLE